MSDNQQLRKPMVRRKSGMKRLATVLAFGVVVLLGITATFPLWFPPLARAVIPDRYIVAYAPDFVQEMVFDREALEEELAEVEGVEVSDQDVSQLIEDLDQNIAPTATPMPTIDSVIIQPTDAPSPTPEPTTIPTVEFQSLASFPSTWEDYIQTPYAQGWNRCGPATLSRLLSYLGGDYNQNVISEAIKPEDDDRNVRPDEMADFARSQGYEALVRVDGDIDLLIQLVSAGYPVIVERGLDELEPEEAWMGHYMLVFGYSLGAQEFYAHDSFFGPDETWDFAEFDRLWRHFNRTYMVVYDRADNAEVAAIIGEEMNDDVMYANAVATAREEIETYNDSFAWYNLGAALTWRGQYQQAATAFDVFVEFRDGDSRWPWRIFWYRFELYEAYLQTERYGDVIQWAAYTVDGRNYPMSEEGHYYIGAAYEGQGLPAEARKKYNRSLQVNPGYQPAQQALDELNAAGN